ncbi:MAG: transposase family protein [Clostridiales bacterium]|nr:transposase family protein [Clostridiales bacterium]
MQIKKMEFVRAAEAQGLLSKLDDHFLLCDIQEDSFEKRFYIQSLPQKCSCPSCGEITERRHGSYIRNIQDVPDRNGKKVILRVMLMKYECHNEKCRKKVFSEPLPFCSKNAIKTEDLNEMIIRFDRGGSLKEITETLNSLGVEISINSVRRCIRKQAGYG